MIGAQTMAVAAPRTGWRWPALLASVALLALTAFPSPGRAQDEDLPGRVGRVADFAGQLLLSPEDRPDEWEAIGVNYPVTSGGNLWVSGDGRAEVDYGGGQFRLAGDTNVHVSRLDDRQLALFIAQGRLIVRVRSLDPGDATRIDTPNTQVTLTRAGLYRIDVMPDRTDDVAHRARRRSGSRARERRATGASGPDGGDHRRGRFRRRRPLRGGCRRLRHLERQSRPALRSRAIGDLRVAPDGRVCGSRRIRIVADAIPTTAPSGSQRRSRRAGRPIATATGPRSGLGARRGSTARPGAMRRSTTGAGRTSAVAGGGARARTQGVRSGLPRSWPGTAAPSWAITIGHGAPVYGWVPLGWREAYHPTWRRCSYNCWSRYNRPYAVNVAVRPSAPPARYANAAVPGAMSAVTGSTLVGRRPVTSNLLDVPAPLATSAPVMATAPPLAPRQRPQPVPQPSAAGGRDAPPVAASTYARMPRPEPVNPRGGARPSVRAWRRGHDACTRVARCARRLRRCNDRRSRRAAGVAAASCCRTRGDAASYGTADGTGAAGSGRGFEAAGCGTAGRAGTRAGRARAESAGTGGNCCVAEREGGRAGGDRPAPEPPQAGAPAVK